MLNGASQLTLASALLLLSYLMQSASCISVKLSTSLNRDRIYFGGAFTVQLNVTVVQQVEQNVTVEALKLNVFLPLELTFNGSLERSHCGAVGSCSSTGPASVQWRWVTGVDFSSLDVQDKNVTNISIIEWQPASLGDRFFAKLYFDHVTAANLRKEEFVIAEMEYWSKIVDQADTGVSQAQATNTKDIYRFRLVPIQPEMTVPNTPTKVTEYRLRPSVAALINASVQIDQSGLPATVTFSTSRANQTRCNCVSKYYDGSGEECFCESVMRPLANLKLLGSNGCEKCGVHATSTSAAESGSLVLNFGGTSADYCESACRYNMALSVELSSAEQRTGEAISVSAETLYGNKTGEQFVDLVEFPPFRFTGPDLALSLQADPSTDLQAGDEMTVKLRIAHTNISTELASDARIHILCHNCGLEMMNGSCMVHRWREGASNSVAMPCLANETIFGTISLGSLNFSDIIEFHFGMKATDELPLSAKTGFSAIVDFRPQLSNSSCDKQCFNGGVCQSGRPMWCSCAVDFSGADCSQRNCDKGWTAAKSPSASCFKLFNQSVDYSTAAQTCEDARSQLAVASSASKHHDVTEFLQEASVVNEAWLGLSQQSNEWQWADGTKAEQYFVWVGDPSDNAGLCAAASSEANFAWRRRACSETLPFVCERIPSIPDDSYRNRVEFFLATMKLSVNRLEMLVPWRVNVHQPLYFELQLEMPFGTLNRAALEISFASSQSNNLPISFVNDDLTISKHLNVIDTERRKRDVLQLQSSETVYKRRMGTVKNSLTNGRKGATISYLASFVVTEDCANCTGSLFTTELAILIDGARYILGQKKAIFAQSALVLSKTIHTNVSSPSLSEVVAHVAHRSNSSSAAYELEYEDDLDCMQLVSVDAVANQQSLLVDGRLRIRRSVLDVNDSMTVRYLVTPTDDLQAGRNYRNASLNFTSLRPGELIPEYPGRVGKLSVSTCLVRNDDVVVNENVHDNVYSAIAFVVAFVSMLLVVLLCLFMWYQRRPDDEYEEIERTAASGTSNPDDPVTVHLDSPMPEDEDFGAEDSSIVPLLAINDQGTVRQKLERLSAAERISAERTLQGEQLQSMVEASSTGDAAADIEVEAESILSGLDRQCSAAIASRAHTSDTVDEELALHSIIDNFAAKKQAAIASLQLLALRRRTAERSGSSAEDARVETLAFGERMEGWYDRQRARQRALLQNRHNLRKFLAGCKNIDERQRNELFQLLKDQQLSTIDQLQRNGAISAEDAIKLRAKTEEMAAAAMQQVNIDKRQRAQSLSRHITAEKRRKLDEMKKRHAQELSKLKKAQIDKKTDPLTALRERLELLANQREEILVAESGMDNEGARRFGQIQTDITDKLLERLRSHRDGLKPENLNTTGNLDIEVESLLDEQKRRRSAEIGKMEERMARKQKRLIENIETEVDEQKTLRDHEKAIYRHLIGQQTALSEAERDELMRLQHEHLSRMRRSLAVQKLSQHRSAGNEISKRRSIAQQKAEQFALNTDDGGSASESSADDGKAERPRKPERTRRVSSVENRAGRFLAQLQLQKAKQMTKLQAEERALERVTASMVGDLVERNALTNPDSQRILERHAADRDHLGERLSKQRDLQAKQLRQSLEERALLRRRALEREQTRRLRSARRRPHSSHVSRVIASMRLVCEQAAQADRLAHESLLETDQFLAQQYDEFEEKKRAAMQQQELALLESLVKSGSFRRDELSSVLGLVFPQKSTEEIDSLVQQLFSEVPESDTKRKSSTVPLLDRIGALEGGHKAVSKGRPPRNRQASRGGRSSSQRSFVILPPIASRPEPIGAASVDVITEHLPPRRLSTTTHR